MRRTLAFAGSVTLLAGLLSACSTDDPGAVPSAANSPTYNLPPRPVRLQETPIRAKPAEAGDLVFTVIGLRTAMPTLAGSHAEWEAKGQFVRVRLIVASLGRTVHRFDTGKQRLVTADGRSYEPDGEAMLIKRQPAAFDLGSGMRIEFDLWYDIPRAARVRAIRLVGKGALGTLEDPRAEIPLA